MLLAPGLTGVLWLGHPKPRDDELLSSWVVRIAAANGAKLHSFCSVAWPHKAIWNRDIDKCADESIVTKLSDRTGTSIERARQTTLAAYEGSLYERHNPHGDTTWIMPLGIYHRVRRAFGLQFCPQCLSENVAFYRRSWRVAFVTVCVRHGLTLFDRCPRCGHPVNFHRQELGHRSVSIAVLAVSCTQCGYDYRRAADFATEADPLDVEVTARLLRALTEGLATLPTGQETYAPLYFDVLHRLMRLVALGPRSISLRRSLALAGAPTTLDSDFTHPHPVVEDLSLPTRRATLRSTIWLLEHWPERFVDFCTRNHAWESLLLKDFHRAPYWFWSVVHQRLNRKSVDFNLPEIESAIKYLRRSGSIVNQMTVSRLLGARDVFRKRSRARALLNADRGTSEG